MSGWLAVTEVYTGYDIVGDVHGCADSLQLLLEKLGYVKRKGCFQYSNQRKPRQIIFVGDILDRGPKIRESVALVRDMVEAGHAQLIMGNHEYNALGYSEKNQRQQYLRSHNPRHDKVIKETLEQYANHPADWADLLNWIYTLPLFLEFDHFRVVHACWDQLLIDEFKRRYQRSTIDREFLLESEDYHTFASKFMNRTTRGASLLLPDELSIIGSDGFSRRNFRVKYWIENPSTYSDIEFQPDPLDSAVAARLVTDEQKEFLPYYGPDSRFLFMGHYWLSGIPAPLTHNIACLDYSAVKGGRMVAYRLDDESSLSADKFVWVDGN